jgi:hypothetical protein
LTTGRSRIFDARHTFYCLMRLLSFASPWVVTAALVAGLMLASCSYPTTQLVPVEYDGKRLEDQLTAAVERGDFAEAQRLCELTLMLAQHSGALADFVSAYEKVLWIRWARGDDKGALAASAQMAEYARRCAPEQQRVGLMRVYFARAFVLAHGGEHAGARAAGAELDRIATQPADRPSVSVIDAWNALYDAEVGRASNLLAAVDEEDDNDTSHLFVFRRVCAANRYGCDAAPALHQRLRNSSCRWLRAAFDQRLALEEYRFQHVEAL